MIKSLLNGCVMKMQTKRAAKPLFLSLLMATGLGGCAVYPPYAYDPYPYGYGYGSGYGYGYAPPVYVDPPVSLDLGFGFYDYGGRHFGGHHWHGGFHGGHGHGGFHGGHGGWRH
jgi:hypothetical protein